MEKICNFVQNLAQNRADWYMNGLLFLEKLVFVWVYFQIPWQHIPTKTKPEYPPGPKMVIVHALVVTVEGLTPGTAKHVKKVADWPSDSETLNIHSCVQGS